MGFTQRLVITMENQAPYEVTIDQRDLAKWEVQPFNDDTRDMRYTKIRFLGFSAASRGKHTELSWPKFDALCVDVNGVPDSEADDGGPSPVDQSDAT